MGRYDILHRIEQLDPLQDYTEIYRLIVCYEFPWDFMRAGEVALYRTFCVPSISVLLDKTGEFACRAQKRYDDTGLLLAEMSAHGFDSERGRAAQRRMNRIHKHFDISNEDFLYVLSTFIYEPIRWNARFGWRKLTGREQLAAFHFWCEIGRRMNIKAIPESYEEFEQYNIAYERDHFRYADTNRRVAEATHDLFLSWFPLPGFMRSLLKSAIYALLDDAVLDAFGFPHPSKMLRQLLAACLKARAFALRLFPPRKTPFIYVEQKHRSYSHGYTLADLGPPHMLAMLNHSEEGTIKKEV
jgi:hypothetical protein